MNMTSRSLILVLVVFASLLAGGCRKPARPVPAALANQDPSSWPVHEDRVGGFAVALPGGWEVFDLTPGSIDKTLADAVKRFPSLKPLERSLHDQAAQGMTFMAIDTFNLPADFATNLNIGKARDRGPPSLEQAVADLVEEYDAQPEVHGPVTHRRVKLAAGDAECISWTATRRLLRGNPERAAVTQYVLLRRRQVFFLTFATKQDQVAEYQDSFEKIAQTFRFLDK
jgi:hypothetical protein